MLLNITPSELMALRSILLDYILKPDHIEQFIDFSHDPPVETKPEDLLLKLVVDTI